MKILLSTISSPVARVKLRFKKYKVRSKQLILPIAYCLFPIACFSQEKAQDTTKVTQLDEVLVSAVRATAKTPVTYSNLDKKDIKLRNLGQDIPILMNFMPSVVTTSDAGNGVGYTGIRVRGIKSVNVTINGIPYTQSEEQDTYFVDIPDIASFVENLQLQRGVGTSTNGASAFGASLNLLTDSYSKQSNGEISNSFGSFNTRKHTIKFSTGLLNDHFELAGRLSNIDSHGYIDRATSDLKSYFLQGTYVGRTTLIKAVMFGGKEKTYQAWYGVDAEMLENDRTFNYAGMYTDAFGNTKFYKNQTDNYQQDHYQLHWNEKFSQQWNTNLAVHYTKGKGYYEEYQNNQQFADYGLTPINVNGTVIDSTDLVRQKWLDNDFYGTTFSARYKKNKFDLILGGAWNKYEGKHFGKVIWARYASTSELGAYYYNDFATKMDGNLFTKTNYQLSQKISLYVDLQYRKVNYNANGVETGLVDDTFNFFNPKAGLNYNLNLKNTLYFSYARANREPNRADYEGVSVKPESLNDFELGWRYANAGTRININGYYMLYNNQLVLTGKLDDVGNPIRTNVGKSYRLGLEIDAAFQWKKWAIQPNITLSSNKNIDFVNDNGTGLEKLGNTNISYSPNILTGNTITFKPNKSIQIAFLTKFVGNQYLSNLDDPNSKLKSYSQSDLSLNYELKLKSVFKSIVFSGLINNVFDEDIVSNGADYGGGYVYYYPQAGINFLAGLILKF